MVRKSSIKYQICLMFCLFALDYHLHLELTYSLYFFIFVSTGNAGIICCWQGYLPKAMTMGNYSCTTDILWMNKTRNWSLIWRERKETFDSKHLSHPGTRLRKSFNHNPRKSAFFFYMIPVYQSFPAHTSVCLSRSI